MKATFAKIWLLLIWLCVFTLPVHAEPTSTAIITSLIISAITTAASVGIGILAQYLSPKPKAVEVNKANPSVQESRYGVMIPRIRSTFEAVSGQIIDYFPDNFKETRTTTPGQGGKHKTPDTVNFSYSVTLALLICDNQTLGISKITLDTDVFYTGDVTGDEVTATPAGCSGLHIVVGKQDQDPDSVFVDYHGVGNVPAYRGCTVIYFYDLVLDKYYNRIPQITVTVVADNGDLQEIIASEIELTGLTVDDYDLAALAGETINGLFIGDRTSIRSTTLEPIAIAKQIDWVMIDGKITAVQRAKDSEVTIPFEHLGAYDYNQSGQPNTEKPPATKSSRIQDQDIPRGVEINYADTGRAGEPNSQSYRREIFDSFEQESINLPLAMTANEANRIAKVEAITRWTQREPFTFSLPPQYIKYTPSTVMTITTLEGRTLDVIVEKINAGIPAGVLAVEAKSFIKEAYEQVGEGDVGLDGSGTRDGGYQSTPITLPGVITPLDTLMIFSNLDGLNPIYAGLSGFYIWVTIDVTDTTPDAAWRGVTIYQDKSGVGALRALAVQNSPSIFGIANNILADGSGVDTVNTVVVDLKYGTIDSIEDEDFTAQRPLNLFVVGGEVIQARDVSQPDVMSFPNRYTLSHLRRGLRGTMSAESSHSANEQVALIDSSMIFISIPPEDAGDSLGYYAAGPGESAYDTSRHDYAYGAPETTVYQPIEQDFGDGSTTDYFFYHGFNTFAINVSFYDWNGVSWFSDSANSIQVTQAPAPTSNHVSISRA